MKITFAENVKKALGLTDEAAHALQVSQRAGDPRIRTVEPTARKVRRVQATARKVGSRKRQKMATDRWFRERHQRHNALGIARVYLNTDGAHERSPEVARNATQRVHREAERISKRDGIPFTAAIKVVEGDLMNLAHSAGLR